MAGERTLPGLGLTGFWTSGTNGWDTGNDVNLRTLSAVTQLAVISAMTALPAGSDGDMYIVPSGEANGDDVAIKDDGSWVYLTPNDGWRAWVADTDSFVYWDGVAWSPETGGGDTEIGINPQTGTTYTFVLGDSKKLVTADNAAAQTFTMPDNATTAFPVGTMISLKGIGAGTVSFIVDGTDTLNGVAGGGGDISAQWGHRHLHEDHHDRLDRGRPARRDRVMLHQFMQLLASGAAGATTPGEYANLLVYPLTYDITDQNGANSLIHAYPENPQITPEGWLGAGNYLKLDNTSPPAWLTNTSAAVSMYCRLRVDGKNRNGSRDLVVGLGPNSPFYSKFGLGVTHEADMNVAFTRFEMRHSSDYYTMPLCSALWNFGFSWPNEYFLDGANRIRPQGIHFVDADTLLMTRPLRGHGLPDRQDRPSVEVGHRHDLLRVSLHPSGVDVRARLGRHDLDHGQRHAEDLPDRPRGQFRRRDAGLRRDLRHDRVTSTSGHRDRDHRRHRVPDRHGIRLGRGTAGSTSCRSARSPMAGHSRSTIGRKRFVLPRECQGGSMHPSDGYLYTCHNGTSSTNDGPVYVWDIATDIASTADGGSLTEVRRHQTPTQYPEDITWNPGTGECWIGSEGYDAVDDYDPFMCAFRSPLVANLPVWQEVMIDYDGAGTYTITLDGQFFGTVARTPSETPDRIAIGAFPSSTGGWGEGFFVGRVEQRRLQGRAFLRG